MRRRIGLVCVIAAAAAGCNAADDFLIVNREDLASLAQTVPQGYCCKIAVGETAQPIGHIDVDPADRELAFFPAPVRQLGFGIDQVTPPGVLEFTWNGPFIADGHLDPNPNNVPMPFDPAVDVGGLPGTRRLSFSATSCEFERASFIIVVFEYETVDLFPDPEDESNPLTPFLGTYRIVSRQRQLVEIVNCEATHRIAFARTMPEASSEIWTTDLDGDETQLTIDIHTDIDPAWSPDRTRIAFSSNRVAPSYELYTMNADTTGVQPATGFERRVEDPAWSPDGTAIAVSVDEDLWIVDASPPIDPPRLLTEGEQSDVSPSWSPDGTRIAFVRDGDIYVVPADGSAAPAPLVTGLVVGGVDWSSQGELVFDRYDQDVLGFRIWRANGDGSNQRAVTGAGDHYADRSPSWSPGGDRIVFVREQIAGGTGVVHVADPDDGSNAQPIPDQQDDNRDPDW